MNRRPARIAIVWAAAWVAGTLAFVLPSGARLGQVFTSGYWLIFAAISGVVLLGSGIMVYWPILTWRLAGAPDESDLARGAIGAALGLVIVAALAVAAVALSSPRSPNPAAVRQMFSDPGNYLYVGLCVAQGLIVGLGVKWAAARP